MNFITIWDEIRKRWSYLPGLILTIFIAIILFYFFIHIEELDTFRSNNPFIVYIIFPIVIIILLIITWYLTTNRLFIDFSDKINVGVSISADNEKEKIIVDKVLRKVVKTINKSNTISGLTIRVLPANIFDVNSELKVYHKKYRSIYDSVMKLTIESGQENAIEKIKLQDISASFTNRSHTDHFYDESHLVADLSIQTQSLNWEYLFTNSMHDKKKYQSNFYHILLCYLAFYAVYINRMTIAFNILEAISPLAKNEIKVNNNDGDSITIDLTPKGVADGRLKTITVDVFSNAAIISYQNEDIDEALRLYRKLEKLHPLHHKLYLQYMNMATYSYKIGNIQDAKVYTRKLEDFFPQSEVVFLNYGFFAILEQNTKEVCSNYRKLFQFRKRKSLINWVDVLSFQQEQREKIKDRNEYFKFTTAFISYLFIGDISKAEFREIIMTYKANHRFECIYKLGKSILKSR